MERGSREYYDDIGGMVHFAPKEARDKPAGCCGPLAAVLLIGLGAVMYEIAHFFC